MHFEFLNINEVLQLIYSMRLHLIRHGESTGNLIHQIQSILDTDLTQNGYNQAKELRGKFDVQVVYHSPLKRARETANTVFENSETELIEMKDLIEEDVGMFVGKLGPDLTEEERKIWQQFVEDHDFTDHGGESRNQIIKRSRQVMKEIVKDMKQRGINEAVAISHGGLLRTFLRDQLEIEKIEMGNCSIFSVEYNLDTDKWILLE